MDAQLNGPAITPSGAIRVGAYYFKRPQTLDALPLEAISIGDEMWISMPGNRLRFTGWVVVRNDEVASANLAIEPGTAAPVVADGKHWMLYVRAEGDVVVLELTDQA